MTSTTMNTMTDLLNDCWLRDRTVRIHAAGRVITGVVSDVTTDLVEVISPEGVTMYVSLRSVDVVVLLKS